ncbi:MAG TPA: hypothetical protein PKA13_04160 [Geminicoccaceae bacterium]|nr:hypothetical protein [Geminicoccus sp.]HMU48942.1 hypothetical protein [Geminicoccaceae bacterium]
MKRYRVVTGDTAVVPLVGHPVAQVRTPGPMNRWFAEQQIPAVVVPMDIRPERVADFFDVLKAMENCVGCSITMPHKQAAFLASDEVTERARHAKSVNIIRRSPSGRLIGDMTDGLAFVAALAANSVEVRGRNVLLVGAGAAGTAIAFEVAQQGARSMTVLEVDQMRRRALVTALAELFPAMAVAEQVPPGQPIEIAINASPVGMGPNDPLPYPVEQLGGALIVADAVTRPNVTRWLAEAARRGLKIQTGEEMALAQLPIQLPYLRFRPASPSSGYALADTPAESAGP